MDDNKEWLLQKKIERTLSALEKNNMKGWYVKESSDVLTLLKDLIPDGTTVSVGGSRTLFETGVLEFLRAGDYHFLDRYEEGLSPADIKKIYRATFSADVFLSSSNAITENGELYNVDGTGNRTAAMIYGPDKVILICGYNKIVKDIDAAIEQNKRCSAPANAKRLNRKTPCVELGYCTDCKSPDRICNDFVVIKRQGIKDRIHVILVGETLGY
jgi:hypothetical protein